MGIIISGCIFLNIVVELYVNSSCAKLFASASLVSAEMTLSSEIISAKTLSLHGQKRKLCGTPEISFQLSSDIQAVSHDIDFLTSSAKFHLSSFQISKTSHVSSILQDQQFSSPWLSKITQSNSWSSSFLWFLHIVCSSSPDCLSQDIWNLSPQKFANNKHTLKLKSRSVDHVSILRKAGIRDRPWGSLSRIDIHQWRHHPNNSLEVPEYSPIKHVSYFKT